MIGENREKQENYPQNIPQLICSFEKWWDQVYVFHFVLSDNK